MTDESSETEATPEVDAEAGAHDESTETGELPIGRAIEAICMVADEPVPSSLLAEVLDVSVDKIEEVCAQLAASYEADLRGFVMVNVAGGWRYQSHADMAAHVERFVLDGQTARLSGAALETLAIVAYKQPISRAQIAAIRGVNVDGVLKTLQQRGYVAEVGQSDGPGQAMFFGTTTLFLEKLGIASLADLPPLGEFIPGADLVEVLEQGLRPSSMVDLGDGDYADPVEANIEAEVEAAETDQIDLTELADTSLADTELADDPDFESVAAAPHANASNGASPSPSEW